MPENPSRYAVYWQRCREHPVAAALVAGLLLRLVSACRADGWFASDDYLYVLAPAGEWLRNPGAAFPSHYRSPLLAWGVYGAFRFGQALGVSSPNGLVHVAYVSLGVWSLLAIPATYRLAKALFGEAAARQAVWLMAAQALMPQLSARALIEVAAIPLVVWGWALWATPGDRPRLTALVAGLSLGGACLLRFQLGLLALALVAVVLWQICRRVDEGVHLQASRRLPSLLVGLLLASFAQVAMDWRLGRPAFGTVLGYLQFNAEHSADFGRSPWYSYVVQLGLLTLPPLTFVLVRPMWQAARRAALVSVPLGVYVAVHSAIAHKEDRFLFSVWPLFFVLLGAALVMLDALPLWRRRVLRTFWGLNLVALVPATLANPQRALVAPLTALREAQVATVSVVGIRRVPKFYLLPETEVLHYDDVATWLATPPKPVGAIEWVLLRASPDELTTQRLAASQRRCASPTYYAPDRVDQVLLAMNPQHSRRRAGAWLWQCQAALPPREP